MNISRFERLSAQSWRLAPTKAMRVPSIIYADETLLADMDDKVGEQLANVASLPGIVGAAYAMPDAHWGYGFPIGGVAAFDADSGGIVSAGGVGFDISCGVRTLITGIDRAGLEPIKTTIADTLFRVVPAGLGSRGAIVLDDDEMDAMLTGGARWAVERGWGKPDDLHRIEEHGVMPGADPTCVSPRAKQRQRHLAQIL
jgi:tRNA-splicing ligase RtcB (3'-phosphate/5'-hydroxy nucleic acid ligase)